MLLSEIPEYIECRKIYNFRNKKIHFNFLCTNSKYIRKNSLLIVNKKNKFKEKYIKESISNGAVGIITNSYYKKIKAPQFLVSNIDKSLKILLKKIKKYPPNNILAVTGTNGKSSVVSNISYINFFSKKNSKSYGTLGYYKNLKKIENSILTTPEYEILYQKAFSNNNSNKFDFIFEVSSHSISKKRISNFPINIAALTNITQDHLDFHRTINNYKKTKLKLFLNHLEKGGIAILNDEISGINTLKKKLLKKDIKIITYGNKKSDIYIYQSKLNHIIKIHNKKYSCKLRDYCKFEITNLACSIACNISLGLSISTILKAIPKIKKPIGRFQIVGKLNNNAKILVDYAHTPDALKNILIVNTFKKIKPNIIFGCGGGRDKSKRSIMGSIANKYANKVYITDDNPRNENPANIRKSILKRCPKGKEISSRSQAIKIAINELKSNEVLIIAGKGHEKKQILKDNIINFDDTKIVENYIKKENFL